MKPGQTQLLQYLAIIIFISLLLSLSWEFSLCNFLIRYTLPPVLAETGIGTNQIQDSAFTATELAPSVKRELLTEGR